MPSVDKLKKSAPSETGASTAQDSTSLGACVSSDQQMPLKPCSNWDAQRVEEEGD